jgi:uncharacterized protein
MANVSVIHYPQLDTVLMVEHFIQEHDGEFKKRQLWEHLPKKMMYQTYDLIIEYLLYSRKVSVDAEGKIGWIHYPERINRLKHSGLFWKNEMKTREDSNTLRQLKSTLYPILKRYGIKKAGIFGSMARGDARSSSDIDLLIDMKKDASLLDLAGLKVDLEDAVGRTVDLVEYKVIKPEIKNQILSEEVVIL